MPKKPPAPKHTKGFTLIEISMVLMVIGFIAGGVVVGKSLMEAAKVRQLANQIHAIDLAVSTFETKYDCLPGDCAAADTLGLNAGGGTNGNGNGQVDNVASAWDPISMTWNGAQNEYNRFWLHLKNAELIVRDSPSSPWYEASLAGFANSIAGTAIPTNIDIARNSVFAQTWSDIPIDKHYYWVKSCTGLGPVTDPCGTYTPTIAMAVDNKLDDGLPMSGRVRAGGDGGSWGVPETIVPGAGGETANVCVSNTENPMIYNVVNTSGQVESLCTLLIEAEF